MSVDVLRGGSAAAKPRARATVAPVHVCMIAYTEYATDARVRLEAETLAADAFHVICLTTKNDRNRMRFTLQGVDVRELGVAKYRGKSVAAYVVSYLRFLFSSASACLGLLWRGQLDVVHVHNVPDFLVFAGLIPRLAGCKVVLDVHDSVPETFGAKFSGGAWMRRALCLEERLSARVAHRVICVNHPQRDLLVRRGIPLAKTIISMNVPDPGLFRTTNARATATNADTVRLVYHGTMAHRLGVDLLICAVRRVRESIPNVTLHLWGRGDDLAEFQALARELGISEHVVFEPAGFRLEELPERLRTMDLGLVGNRRNDACDLMLPVKLLEYVALGIPVVAPRLPAIERYFTDDMVTYYEPENIQSLADAILRLHANDALASCQAARAREFLVQYGWEHQGKALVNMYRTLVES